MKNIKNSVKTLHKTKLTDFVLTTTLLVLLIVSSVFLVFSTVTTVQAAVPNNLLQYEWCQPQANPEGTSFSDGPAPNAPNIKWKTTIEGVSGQPVAFGGFVFVQAGGATYALDGGTGEIV